MSQKITGQTHLPRLILRPTAGRRPASAIRVGLTLFVVFVIVLIFVIFVSFASFVLFLGCG